jgi:hypothetical protein
MNKSAQLVYSLLCDDVRLELGNKLSLMGLFENLFLQAFPAVILKFSVVNHWIGVGDFETQVRVVSPDGREVAVSAVSPFRIESQGYADNVTFFANVSIDRSGTYTVRTYLDGKVISERPMFVRAVQQAPTTVN